MNRKIVNQQKYWNSLAILAPDASVIDPKDKLGFKNSYIARIRDHSFCSRLKEPTADNFLLDFGCGTGSATINLLNKGYDVVGVDISEGLLRVAKQRCEKKTCLFVLNDGKSIPFKSGSFSAAVDYVVLSYVIDDEKLVQLLSSIRLSLQPGANFLMIEQVRKSRLESEPGLKVQRTLQEWNYLFERAGFTCVSNQIVRYGHFPFIYLIRYGFLPKFFWPMLMRLEKAVGGVFGILPWGYAEVLFEVKA